MLADISGFTPLTESLARALAPDRGAEELTHALNSVLTPLIAATERYGGQVIKFAGDALIIFFPHHPRQRRATLLHRAISAAHAMQVAIRKHGQIATPVGIFTLTMKIGMAYGPVARVRLGDPKYGYEDVIGGTTLDRMAAAEHHAAPGEVVLDPKDVLLDHLTVTEWRHGYAVLAPPQRLPRRVPLQPLLSAPVTESLRFFVPSEIAEAVIAGRAYSAELKPVVSAFVRFTGISYEDLAAIEQLAHYFSTIQAIVARYGGRVNRLITGDKGSVIHLIYGAPRALEACEQRAALAALELLRAGERLPFISHQQIGMAYGRVFAGPVGSPKRCEYTVMGDTINLSARLMQQAAPNQIVIDDDLAKRLAPHFVMLPLGETKLKGKAEPVSLVALTGIAQTASPTPITHVYGRDRELLILHEQLTALNHGQGSTVVVIGELGMGKTHLLSRVRAASPARWIQASASPYDQLQSGALMSAIICSALNLDTTVQSRYFIYALQPYLGARAPEAALILARLVGIELSDEQQRQLAIIGSDGVRWQLFMIIEHLITAIAHSSPLVIALDDLQWADITSFEIVQHLASLTAHHPFLLALLSRPLPPTDATNLRQHADYWIELSPLTSVAALGLIRAMHPGLTSAEAQILVERSGGNPLFLVELARAITTGAGIDTLPDTVQGLMLAQLDRLPTELRDIVQQAAVLGRQFTPEVLGLLTNAADLEQHLTDLVERGLLTGNAQTGYRFRHALIQESAYSALLFARRREQHLKVASVLIERARGQLAERAGELAEHYERAEQFMLAARWSAQAGDQARLIGSSTDALAAYQRALTLADRAGDDPLRATTMLKIAQVAMDSDNYRTAQQYYEQAFIAFSQSRSTPTSKGKTRPFRLGVYTQGPTTLDPGLIATSGDQEIVRDLFEGLVELDLDLNVTPALAARWEVSETGRCYTFYLRPNLYWSDGSPLTAHDFIFAWQRNLNPATEAPQAHILSIIAGADEVAQGADPDKLQAWALDDRTLQLVLRAPAPHLPYLLTHPVCMPQPSHAIRRYGATWASPSRLVCNGPFRVAHSRAGRPLVLAFNPHYYGHHFVAIRRIELIYVNPDISAFIDHQIDWLRIEDHQPAPDQSSLIDLFGLTTYFLLFNCRHPFFQHPDTRRAFAHCLDTARLVNNVWGGRQLAASGGLIPPGMSGHTPGIHLEYDPAKARSILLPSPTPHLTLAALDGFRSMPEELCAAWRQHLGVEVQIRTDLTPDQLFACLQTGQLTMALLGWDFDYPDPQPLLHGLFHSQGSLNVSGWRNATYDALIEQIDQADLPTRRQLVHIAEQLLAREAVAVPLYYHRALGALRSPFTLTNGQHLIRGDRPRLKWLGIRRTD